MFRNAAYRMTVTCGLGALLIGVTSGCGGGSSAAFTPSTTSARDALDSALAGWKKGDKPDALAKASPAVVVVDSDWQAGNKLDSYEILDEVQSEQERTFKVALTPAKTKKRIEVNYIVLGKDPLWVYREADYASSNMGGPPPSNTRGGSRGPRKR
jgi:hypothetical protein